MPDGSWHLQLRPASALFSFKKREGWRYGLSGKRGGNGWCGIFELRDGVLRGGGGLAGGKEQGERDGELRCCFALGGFFGVLLLLAMRVLEVVRGAEPRR